MDFPDHDIESFNTLGMDEQMNIAKHKATLVEHVEEEYERIELYNYHDFFIEIVFRKELRITKSIRAIDTSEYAEKYIELEDMGDY